LTLDIKIAWRNIWRNPRRSALTMAAVAFAAALLVFMLSWQFGSYRTMINAAVKTHTGHLQVQAKGYRKERKMRLAVSDPEAVGHVLQGIPEVAAYTFRADAFSLVSSEDRTYGIMVIGIEPDREMRVSTLEQTIQEGAPLAPGDGNQALVGALLAKNLRARPGDELVVLGQGMDGSVAATVVKIKGIFRSGEDEFDRSVMHVPLPFFQEAYAMGKAVHEVVAVADSLDHVPAVVSAVRARLADIPGGRDLTVLSWKQLMPGLVQAIRMDLVSGFFFYIILVVVVAFSILNTFIMAVFERTRELGVFMAMGTTPGRLTRILLLESCAMTILGVAFGIALGGLTTWYFQVHGILIPGAEELARQFGLPSRMYPELSLLSVGAGAGSVLGITLLAALYPALRIRRLRPVDALAAV